jgi:hypothetical protein
MFAAGNQNCYCLLRFSNNSNLAFPLLEEEIHWSPLLHIKETLVLIKSGRLLVSERNAIAMFQILHRNN